MNQAVKSLNQRRATVAALQNEEITRQRVERLKRQHEKLVAHVGDIRKEFIDLADRGFWGRLRWLFRGR